MGDLILVLILIYVHIKVGALSTSEFLFEIIFHVSIKDPFNMELLEQSGSYGGSRRLFGLRCHLPSPKCFYYVIISFLFNNSYVARELIYIREWDVLTSKGSWR